MRNERCETCRFWDELIHKRERMGIGDCHRFLPAATFMRSEEEVGTQAPIWDFPDTDGDDWCGEWKGIDPAVAWDNRELGHDESSVEVVQP